MGEEPRPDPLADTSADLNQGIEDSRRKAACILPIHYFSCRFDDSAKELFSYGKTRSYKYDSDKQ
jgi:hypothetical protein